MHKNIKNKTKKIRKTYKCVYTDEAKRFIKRVKELRKNNSTQKNNSNSPIILHKKNTKIIKKKTIKKK